MFYERGNALNIFFFILSHPHLVTSFIFLAALGATALNDFERFYIKSTSRACSFLLFDYYFKSLGQSLVQRVNHPPSVKFLLSPVLHSSSATSSCFPLVLSGIFTVESPETLCVLIYALI